MQGVEDAVRRVPQEQLDHHEQEQLAQPVLGESQHVRVIHCTAGEQESQRHGDAGDEHQRRADQGREHPAGAEQRPEDRRVRTFTHLDVCGAHDSALPASIMAIASTTMVAMTAATSPAPMMTAGGTFLPPITTGGMVLGMISNQLQV
jgi:hypothetical protein